MRLPTSGITFVLIGAVGQCPAGFRSTNTAAMSEGWTSFHVSTICPGFGALTLRRLAGGGGVLSLGAVGVVPGVVDGELEPGAGVIGGGADGAVVVDAFPEGPLSAIATAAPTRKAAPANATAAALRTRVLASDPTSSRPVVTGNRQQYSSSRAAQRNR